MVAEMERNKRNIYTIKGIQVVRSRQTGASSTLKAGGRRKLTQSAALFC
jgi:hypothetical protein